MKDSICNIPTANTALFRVLQAINIEAVDFLYGESKDAWSEPVLLLEVVFLAIQAVVYVSLAIYLDVLSANPSVLGAWKKFISIITLKECFGNRGNSIDITVALAEDDDVVAEQERVTAGGANNDTIVVSQLSKIYDNGKVAVNSMSLGIAVSRPGCCFDSSGDAHISQYFLSCFSISLVNASACSVRILSSHWTLSPKLDRTFSHFSLGFTAGINGAGKTTCMGMLTAEFPPTSGDATLAGFSVTREPAKIRRRIGYCPQFDAHFANLTGREHVELYASIKGIPKGFVSEAAVSKLREVGLDGEDWDRLSAGYSGGMKRRLSLACATIGEPQILFLDECSTGVDPVARREIWQLISDMVTRGPEEERTSVILTTHSYVQQHQKPWVLHQVA